MKSNNDNDNNSITNAASRLLEEEQEETKETMKIQLPRTQGQMICEYDIRQQTTTSSASNTTTTNTNDDGGGFNLTTVFDEFYNTKLPGIIDTELRSTIKISGMHDIPQHKWYYPYCDLESHQILATFTIDGYGIFHDNPANYSKTSIDLILSESEKSLKLQEYFQNHVCTNMTSWRSHFDERWDPNSYLDEGNSVHLEHSTYFLCGGADELNNYYDGENEPDGGFLVLGMLVGIVMVLMIIGELQQFDNRSSSSSRSRSRGARGTTRTHRGSRNDSDEDEEETEDSTTYEFEMV